MTKKLTSLEFERMERARLLKEMRTKELAHLKLAMERVDDKQRILELTIRNLEIDRRQINEDRNAVIKRVQTEKDAHESLLAQIKKRLKIAGKFGYNPDSLEVVEDGSEKP